MNIKASSVDRFGSVIFSYGHGPKLREPEFMPAHTMDVRYQGYSPSVEGLTQLVACYDSQPQLAASLISKPLCINQIKYLRRRSASEPHA